MLWLAILDSNGELASLLNEATVRENECSDDARIPKDRFFKGRYNVILKRLDTNLVLCLRAKVTSERVQELLAPTPSHLPFNGIWGPIPSMTLSDPRCWRMNLNNVLLRLIFQD